MADLSLIPVQAQLLSTTGPYDLLRQLESNPPNVLILAGPVSGLADCSFCQELRRIPRLRSIKVVVIDSDPNIGKRKEALFHGVDQYVSEPLTPELINRILL